MGTPAKRTSIAILLLLSFCKLADAGQVNWTSGKDGFWNDAANWSSAPYLPSFLDDVRIDCPGIVNITHSSGFPEMNPLPETVINSLYCAENLSLNGASLTVSAPSQVTQIFNLDGILTADGLFTCSGRSTWTGGTITGWAGLSNSGSFSITGSNYKNLGREGWTGCGSVLNNYGTITHTGAPISFCKSSLLENHGLYDLQTPNLHQWPASGQVNNFGTFRKSADTNPTDITMPFNNIGGKIDVWTGQLGLSGGGNSTATTIAVADQATLALSGNHVFSGNVTCSGAGSVSLQKGTISVKASGSMASNLWGQGAPVCGGAPKGLQIQGATLCSDGPIITTGASTWISGTISGFGGFTNSGVMTIDTGGTKVLANGILNNSDTIIHKADPIHLADNAVVNNLAGAVYETQYGTPFVIDRATACKINNYGTFRKCISQSTADIYVPFNNFGGNIEVSAGQLWLRNGGNSTGGTITLSNRSGLMFMGTNTVSGAVKASGSGIIYLNDGSFIIDAGGSFVSSVIAPRLEPALPDGSGLILYCTVQADGPIINAGTCTWKPGTIKGRGGLTNTGTLQIEGQSHSLQGSILNNSGVINQTYSQITLANTSVITNSANGVYSMDHATIVGSDTNPSKMINKGVLRCRMHDSTVSISLPFDNEGGAIDICGSTLSLQGGGKCSGGSIYLSDGAALGYSGTHTLSGTLDIDGTGCVGVSEGSFSTQPSSVTNVNLPNNAFNVLNGTAGGAGTINVSSDFTLDYAGTLVTEIIDSHTFGKVNVTGKMLIYGDLDVRLREGYTPVEGDHFDILTYGSHEGRLCRVTHSPLPAGLDLRIEYSDKGATLVVIKEMPAKVLTSIAAARYEKIGTQVILTGAITVAFDDCAYIEDFNRAGGIRVDIHGDSSTDPPMQRPNGTITAQGILAVIDGNLTLTEVTYSGIDPPIGFAEPLFMKTSALGGSQLGIQPGVTNGTGLNNIGLLVRIAGRITYIRPYDYELYTDGYAYVDDGCGLNDGNTLGPDGTAITGVKVMLPYLDMPSIGTFVTVTGISVIDTSTGSPQRAVRALQYDNIQ